MNTTGRMSQADLPQYDRNTSRVNGVRVFVTSCGMNVSVIEMSNPTCNTLNTIVCHQDPGAPAEPIVWRSALRDRRYNRATNTPSNKNIFNTKLSYNDS